MENENRRFIPAGMEDEDSESEYELDYLKDSTIKDAQFCSIEKTAKNLKVSVLNEIHIGAGLNGEDFNIELFDGIGKWFDDFQRNWNIYKRTPALINSLEHLFLTNKAPLALCLKLFANCPGCNNIKTKNLPYYILETFCNLKKEMPLLCEEITDNLKMVAFNFVKTQGLPQMYKAVTDMFELKKSKVIFIQKLKELIKYHYYKDVSQWAVYLELTENFNIYEIPLPLILQDKISIAEDFLDVAKHLPWRLIQLLDSFLDGKVKVSEHCDRLICEYRYDEVNREKLQAKPITKLIQRLAKKYKISNEYMPNLVSSKNFGYLQYLLHKKYGEKCLAKDAWRELVRECASTKKIQDELIYSICSNSDYDEAFYWAKIFKHKFSDLPLLLQKYIEEKDLCDKLEESWDVVDCPNLREPLPLKVEYYKLKLPMDSVIMVKERQDFKNMLEILQDESLIAFDSEWKPSFTGDAVVDLLQIATRTKIFLIDVLSEQFSQDLWKALSAIVFNNNNVLKLGYSIHHDLLMFERALPILNISLTGQTSYLDLQVMWKNVNKIDDFSFPHRASTCGESLAVLVEVCFGKLLDKSNQFSNWANRPLRTEQVVYAALDAYCLIEIYDLITTKLYELKIDVDVFMDNILSDTKNKKHKKKKIPETKLKDNGDQITPFRKPMNVYEANFVCEDMLAGLAKALRKIGCDCVVTKALDREDDSAIKKALNEKRFLLTTGFKFVKALQYLPFGHCYKINSNHVEHQLLEVIKYYNIMITPEDIFSRCQICNCNKFIFLDKHEFMSVKTRKCLCKYVRKPIKEPPPKRNFIKIPITCHMAKMNILPNRQLIKIDRVPDYVIKTVNYFYVCEGCGKCYWDGSHLDKVLNGHLKNYIVNEI